MLVFSFCFLFSLDCAFISNLCLGLKIYNLRRHCFLKPFVNLGILAKIYNLYMYVAMGISEHDQRNESKLQVRKVVNLSMSSLGVFSDECSTFLDMMNDIGIDKSNNFMTKS